MDAVDVAMAPQLLPESLSSQEAAIRCGAVREVFEESGVCIFEPELDLSSDDLSTWRHRVHETSSVFQEMCQSLGVKPAIHSLHYWCSFITPDMEHSRLKKGGFDARFYIWAPHDKDHTASKLGAALADAQETSELVWLTPSEALAAVAAEKIALVPPQWYILKELADACPTLAHVPSYAASAERALQRDYPIKPYPVMLSREEQAEVLHRIEGATKAAFALAFPGDEKHPIFPGCVGARHRLNMTGEMGKKMQFELDKVVPERSLPLKAATSNWYTLARL